MVRILATTLMAAWLAACASPARVTSNAEAARLRFAGGIYKIGTPYQIEGAWYYPKENRQYNQTGTASWYGAKFDGRRTANGEIFDMELLTAAHPTLPMPVRARVTNLENGRTLTLRINDRGPFAKDREIDLSRAAARALGFVDKGTARVRVEYLGRAPLYDVSGARIYGRDDDDVIPPPALAERAPPPAPAIGDYTVQLGVFGVRANAEKLRANVSGFGRAYIEEVTHGAQRLFAVRVAGGQSIHAEIIASGYRDAILLD